MCVTVKNYRRQLAVVPCNETEHKTLWSPSRLLGHTPMPSPMYNNIFFPAHTVITLVFISKLFLFWKLFKDFNHINIFLTGIYNPLQGAYTSVGTKYPIDLVLYN